MTRGAFIVCALPVLASAQPKEVSRICIRNSEVAVLSFKVTDQATGQELALSENVLSGANGCIDIANVPGIQDGNLVLGHAKKALGKAVDTSEAIMFKATSPNQATFRCTGAGDNFSCDLDAPCSGSPTEDQRQGELYQCDRDCRWQFGFNDRSILGQRRAWAEGTTFDDSGNACCCYQETEGALNYGGLIDRAFPKQFDTEDTWSGTDESGFDSPWACVSDGHGDVETMNKEQAIAEKREIIHCGKCAECSQLDQTIVLSTTRKWITYVMTKVSTKFAAPWGHKNVTLLEQDLYDLAVNFSLPLGVDDRSKSCMRCWSDNIMCDAAQCVSKCWTKFFDPTPTEECLKCDERTCGPEFIKCAGANRRSSGIISDISRPDAQVCKAGYYYGKTDDDLPTLPQPSDTEINDVCKRNADASHPGAALI